MAEELRIQNRGEAIDYLMNDMGLSDALISEVVFKGFRAWLTRSDGLPVSIDGGDSYWLLENGEIVNTHVLSQGIADEYAAQYNKPFPFGSSRQEDVQNG